MTMMHLTGNKGRNIHYKQLDLPVFSSIARNSKEPDYKSQKARGSSVPWPMGSAATERKDSFTGVCPLPSLKQETQFQ